MGRLAHLFPIAATAAALVVIAAACSKPANPASVIGCLGQGPGSLTGQDTLAQPGYQLVDEAAGDAILVNGSGLEAHVDQRVRLTGSWQRSSIPPVFLADGVEVLAQSCDETAPPSGEDRVPETSGAEIGGSEK